ncbi:unnamed protein product [Cuscuta epithymum]|uniref:Uncharacterized protein n=1 Tax=Cuscuta epithymum TaxID=186058 RepID=A0AAV0EQL7_9ASTE|nr:unnamed protein product [Cuscuta epithymum]
MVLRPVAQIHTLDMDPVNLAAPIDGTNSAPVMFELTVCAMGTQTLVSIHTRDKMDAFDPKVEVDTVSNVSTSGNTAGDGIVVPVDGPISVPLTDFTFQPRRPPVTKR